MVLADGTITFKERFIPHAYHSLHENDQRNISLKDYQHYIDWYSQITNMTCEKIVYKSDNLNVIGILAKPAVIEQHSKLPVIIYCRGGNEDSRKVSVVSIKDIFYPLVQNGYLVIASQYRGNDGGEGKDEVGGADVQDILALFNTLKSIDYVDHNNIFMIGFSRGPINIYQSLKAGKKPNAVASIAGVADLIQFDQEFPASKEKLQSLILKRLEDYHVEYQKRSVICWPEAIQVPILLLHGNNDTIVNISQSQRLYTLLKQNDTPCKLITYPKGDHFLSSYKKEIIQDILSFFKHYRKN